MKKTYEKPFGTFELDLTRIGDDVKVTGIINGSTTVSCEILQYKKAVRFSKAQMLSTNGKVESVAGCLLPDFDEVYAEYKNMYAAIKNEKVAEVKSGSKKIVVSFHDGEYLSGYTIYGTAADLLEEIGAARYVEGWGSLISDELVKTLGEEFTYEEAVAYMQPSNDAKTAKKGEAQAKIDAIYALAKETGEKQLLSSWSDDCNDPEEDCSLDMVYEYAMPDGSIKNERSHTW